MNLNKTKKINKKFDPTFYWYLLLFVIIILFLILIVYGVFSFFYVKGQITTMESESANSAQNSTSTLNNKEFSDINNLNKVLAEFDKKEVIYRELIKVSANTSSTSIATSTE
jgi:uncharacterized protein YpmS